MVRTVAVMGTFVTIEADADESTFDRAFGWFHAIEERCSRFNPQSELRQLVPGRAMEASAILFEAVRFARAVAEDTAGAFDPAVGGRMSALGFNREYRTGEIAAADYAEEDTSYRDIEIDEQRHTILLRRPLTLDLGAVAKGLAVDTAAKELEPVRNFAIDAGGDLYLGGHNPEGKPWSVGIRHPRKEGEFLARLPVTDQAVCTSGDYHRGGHILDPRTGAQADALASATVVAGSAMLADALATAAFVLGAEQGIALLNRMGVQGFLIDQSMQCHQTEAFPRA